MDDENKYLIDSLADRIIGLSFAMWDQQQRPIGIDILQNIPDKENIDWSIIAFKYIMFYQHMIDSYALGLYGNKFREDLMDNLYVPLIRKYAETGAVSVEKMNELNTIFIDTLNKRNAEYGRYKLEKVIADECEDGIIKQEKEREDEFFDIARYFENPEESLKDLLTWEFGKRIAAGCGGKDFDKFMSFYHRTNFDKVSSFARKLAILGLFRLDLYNELKKIKEISDQGNIINN